MSILQTAYSNDESFWNQLMSDEGVDAGNYQVGVDKEEDTGKYRVWYTDCKCRVFWFGGGDSWAQHESWWAKRFATRAWASMRAASAIKMLEERSTREIENKKEKMEEINSKVEEFKAYLMAQAGI